MTGDSVKSGELADRLTGEVHVGLGLAEQDARARNFALGEQSVETAAAERQMVIFR